MKKYMWTLILIFWTSLIFASKVAELTELLNPKFIVVDGSQIIISQESTIFLYSIKDYKLQKKFGKKGEGPGEFIDAGAGIKVEVESDKLLVLSGNRISTFNRNGEFKSEKRVNDINRYDFKRLGEIFIGTSMTRKDPGVYMSINLYNKDLVKGKELYKYAHPFFPRSKPIDPVNLRVSSYFVYKGQLFIDNSKGEISVYDNKGKKKFMIRPEYKKVKITDVHKKRYHENWRVTLREEYKVFKNRLKFSSYFPPIRNYTVNDGKIYIITYEEKKEDSAMIIYSTSGKFLKTIWVPLADTDMLLPQLSNYFFIYKGKLYILKDNSETEKWDLHIVSLS